MFETKIAFWCFLAAGGALVFARDWPVRIAGLLVIVGTLALRGSLQNAIAIGAVIFVAIILLWGTVTILGQFKQSRVEAETVADEDLPSAEPTECLQCGTSIPSGAAVCSQCGWTYRTSSE